MVWSLNKTSRWILTWRCSVSTMIKCTPHVDILSPKNSEKTPHSSPSRCIGCLVWVYNLNKGLAFFLSYWIPCRVILDHDISRVYGIWKQRSYLYICDVAATYKNGTKASDFPHSLQWRHNKCDGVSNHQHLACLLNRLFKRRSKKIPKLRVTGLCEGNPPVTDGFPSQRARNAENVSIWWRHHEPTTLTTLLMGQIT